MAISRRGIAAVVCAALVLPGCESLAQDEPPAAGETARGVVFEDLNANAARDPGEPGIPGVAVSNGRAVVETDRSGAYELPVSDGTILFVTKPAGWAVPVDGTMLPRFYYVHAPAGTPAALDLRFAGLAPTGPLPASVDFPLTRREEPEDFTALVIADPQTQTAAELDFLRDDLIAEIAGLGRAAGIELSKTDRSQANGEAILASAVSTGPNGMSEASSEGLTPSLSMGEARAGGLMLRQAQHEDLSSSAGRIAFGIAAGDLLYDDLSLYERYRGLMAALGAPWFNVPGNHDVNYRAPDDARSLETYKRHFGPPYYSFDWGRVHFVVLDTVIYKGRKDDNPWSFGGYEGGLDETQLEWLANDLARLSRETPVVLVAHIPLDSTYAGSDAVRVKNRAEVMTLLEGRPHRLSLAGHMHEAQHLWFGPEEGFAGPGELHQHNLAAASGGWWSGPLQPDGIPLALQRDGTPRGYYFLEVRGTEMWLRYKASGHPADYQMRISVDPLFEHATVGPEAPQGFYDPPIPQARLGATEVVVNLFDGGPKSRLAMRIDGGAPIGLAKVERQDPLAVRLKQRIPEGTIYWTPRGPSSHLWAAPLPQGLSPGVHVIEIEAIDDYGQRHAGRKVIEVVE